LIFIFSSFNINNTLTHVSSLAVYRVIFKNPEGQILPDSGRKREMEFLIWI